MQKTVADRRSDAFMGIDSAKFDSGSRDFDEVDKIVKVAISWTSELQTFLSPYQKGPRFRR